MRRPPSPPNPTLEAAKQFAAEFLLDLTHETRAKFNDLIFRNQVLGGSNMGYTYKGIRQFNHESEEYLPEIYPSLEEEAEGLYLRRSNLEAMKGRLEQALASILHRCKNDVQLFRDALPDEFVKYTWLNTYSRNRPQMNFLKANPMLTAPFRVIDEAILFRNRYRLLD